MSIALARIAEVEEEEEEEEFVFRRSTVVKRRIPKYDVTFEEEDKEVKVSHMKELRISLHQNKNDFLAFLDKLTASVEWLVEIDRYIWC